MSYSTAEIWVIILGLAIGTFLIRWSFLGPFSRTQLPPWAMRLLRYTPVAVIPGMVAPMVAWPVATGGQTDPARLTAALAVAVLGMYTKNVLLSVAGGAAVLYLMLYLQA